MRNEIRTVLGLAVGFAAVSVHSALADAGAPPAQSAGATPSVGAHVEPPQVGAALGDLQVKEVRALQSALQRAGHYHGALDGVAGPATQQALASFQRAQVSDGSVLDPTTQRALGLHIVTLAKPATAGGTEVATPTADPAPLAAVPAPAAPVGEEGMKKAAVASAAAVRAVAPAAAGPLAEVSSGAASTPNSESDREIALAELTHEQLEQFQDKLRELGHYSGPIDGLDGPRTRQAFRDFFNHQLGLMTNHIRITPEGAAALGVALAAPTPPEEAARVSTPADEVKVATNAIPAPRGQAR